MAQSVSLHEVVLTIVSWPPQKLIKEGKLAQLQQMYKEWPFFSVTLDMIEMVFAKADPRVAQVRFQHTIWLLLSSYLETRALVYVGLHAEAASPIPFVPTLLDACIRKGTL